MQTNLIRTPGCIRCIQWTSLAKSMAVGKVLVLRLKLGPQVRSSLCDLS